MSQPLPAIVLRYTIAFCDVESIFVVVNTCKFTVEDIIQSFLLISIHYTNAENQKEKLKLVMLKYHKYKGEIYFNPFAVSMSMFAAYAAGAEQYFFDQVMFLLSHGITPVTDTSIQYPLKNGGKGDLWNDLQFKVKKVKITLTLMSVKYVKYTKSKLILLPVQLIKVICLNV